MSGDPDFDIFAAAYPHARARAVEVFGWRALATMGAEARAPTLDIKHLAIRMHCI